MKRIYRLVSVFVLIVAVYLRFLIKSIKEESNLRYVLIPLPVLAAVVFAVLSMSIVLYRVFTFNDCQKEAEELQVEIEQAKESLAKHGFYSE